MPTTCSLVASDAKGGYVVEVVALVIIDSVRRRIGLDSPVFDVEAKAVTTVLADFTELGFQPVFGHTVFSDFPGVFHTVLSVVLHFSVEIFVQHRFFPVFAPAVEKHHVCKLCRTGDRRVDPFAIHEEEVQAENRNFVAD